MLVASADESTLGEPVTFTATVVGQGKPGGTVAFFDRQTLLGLGTLDDSGHASFTTDALSLGGNHRIVAVYDGDGEHLPSLSATIKEKIRPHAKAHPTRKDKHTH